MKSNIVLITSLFVLLIASRLITEIPNFTPTIALVMFTGYLIKNRYLAILVILSSQIISDLYIGIYSSMVFVYGAYVLIAALMPTIIKSFNIKSMLIASFISPTLFYIITNFGVWITGSMYPLSIAGLLSCYVAGIPFFDESLISTVLFTVTIYFALKYTIKKPDAVTLVKK
ncbi:MAG: Uncharacterised protein [Gammaproteobacteria bacterium]|nr:MAG: Uncharacterised protein [Gammaproteobacteria bacterium]